MNYMTRMAIVSMAAVLVLAACGDDDATTTTAPATTTTAASVTTLPTDTTVVSGETVDVSISGFAFVPQNLTVPVGTTVRWTNADGTTHTATAVTGEFNGSMSGGATFEHTFGAAGVFDYVCAIHGTMTGKITVEG